MTEPDRLMLVDINNLGYASMYQPALADLSHNGMSTSAVHGALSSLIKIMYEYDRCTPIILWDGAAQWRKDLYPDYKGQRANSQEKANIRADYSRQSKIIKRIISAMGIPQMLHEDMEADDLAGLIIRSLDPNKYEILMVSSDHDWWQGLADNTAWYSHKTKEFLTIEDLKSDRVKDGPFDSPEHFIECKSLVSDSSDSITGIHGVGMKTAKKILAKLGGWDSIENSSATFKDGSKEKLVVESFDVIKRNRLLMDWSRGLMPSQAPVIEYDQHAQQSEFTEYALEYGLDYVARRYVQISVQEQLIRNIQSSLNAHIDSYMMQDLHIQQTN